jgi:hypothetical protein
VLAATLAGCGTAGPTTSARPPEPPATTVPDLTGQSILDAQDALSKVGVEYHADAWFDLSPRHRDIGSPRGWTVQQTVPEAGTPVTDDMTVYLFALKDAEYTWFQEHPTMPALTAKEGWDLTRADLEAVKELVEYRYVPTRTPEYAKRTTYRAPPQIQTFRDPSVEPDDEWDRRTRFREAPEYQLYVRSLQSPGEPLRTGQLLTVLVRPRPGLDPGVHGVPDDTDTKTWVPIPDPDHHDHDIPGWLCPTRFC